VGVVALRRLITSIDIGVLERHRVMLNTIELHSVWNQSKSTTKNLSCLDQNEPKVWLSNEIVMNGRQDSEKIRNLFPVSGSSADNYD
jgi:hypothetical protein